MKKSPKIVCDERLLTDYTTDVFDRLNVLVVYQTQPHNIQFILVIKSLWHPVKFGIFYFTSLQYVEAFETLEKSFREQRNLPVYCSCILYFIFIYRVIIFFPSCNC